jgi:hypothetical protein
MWTARVNVVFFGLMLGLLIGVTIARAMHGGYLG